jgi:acyl-CoA synthetase (AMP-forming)/AMP-acid ligase II
MIKKRKKRKAKQLNKIDFVLILLGCFLLAFIVTMIVTFWVKGSVPDSLIVAVLGSGGIEAALCAAIKIVKLIKGRKNVEGFENEDFIE